MLSKQRFIRKRRVRSKIAGTKDRPRLVVYRSNKSIYAQIIDDDKGNTIVSASGVDSTKVGEEIAKKAKTKKIKKVVFDRAGYQYHGRVKEVAEAARKEGLEF